MSRRRSIQILSALAVAAASYAALIAMSGGANTSLGFLHITSRSPFRPLLLAAACGLVAWALSLARTADEAREAPRPRAFTFVALLALMVVTLNILLLAQPPPPPPPFNGCFFDNVIGRGFRHFLNCDSPEYLGLAKHPSFVWTHGILQARPLSFGIPWLMAQPLRLVPYLESSGPYTPYAREFVSYILINLIALTAVLVCFARLLECGTGMRGGIELMFCLVLLGANNVTKLFFWTPHTQIFVLLVPCLSMYLTFRLIERGTPLRAVEALVTGLAFGAGVLFYGAFILPVLCLATVSLFMYRRLWPAVLIGVSALLPYAAWAAFVYTQLRTFYNHEVDLYRHFIWIADCARVSLASCVPAAQENWSTFFSMAAPIVAVPALFVFGLRVARYVFPGEAAPPPSSALGRAVALTFVVTTVFMLLEGRYAPRLCWFLVPPLLMVVAVEWQALRLSRPHARWRSFNVGMAIVLVIYVVMLASWQGPYS
jgi:hypothetical protein